MTEGRELILTIKMKTVKVKFAKTVHLQVLLVITEIMIIMITTIIMIISIAIIIVI